MSRQHYPFPAPMTEEGLEAQSEAVSLSGTIPECYSKEEKERRAVRVLALLHVAHPGFEVQP